MWRALRAEKLYSSDASLQQAANLCASTAQAAAFYAMNLSKSGRRH